VSEPELYSLQRMAWRIWLDRDPPERMKKR
jgi:hypothetical protein